MSEVLQGAAQEQLRQYVEQLERLDEEKKAIQDDIRDKFAEAKAMGFECQEYPEAAETPDNDQGCTRRGRRYSVHLPPCTGHGRIKFSLL